jgi:hypothetical protein
MLSSGQKITTTEAKVFESAMVADGGMFEAVLAVVVPGRMLMRIPDVDDPHLRMITTDVLLAFWPATFTHIVYPKPWLKLNPDNVANSMSSTGTAILPPRSIVRSFLLPQKGAASAQAESDNAVDESNARTKQPSARPVKRTLRRALSQKMSSLLLLADEDSESGEELGSPSDLEGPSRMHSANFNPLTMTNVLTVRPNTNTITMSHKESH